MCFIYDKFDTANIEQQAENSRVCKRFKSPGYIIFFNSSITVIFNRRIIVIILVSFYLSYPSM